MMMIAHRPGSVALVTSSAASIDYDAILAQLGAAYYGVDAERRARHIEMLQAVQSPQDVALDYEEEGDNLWTVTVCAWDSIGALSVIAGLFTAYGLDIASVDALTVHLPMPVAEPAPASHRRRRGPIRRPRDSKPALPARKILDIFEVRPDEPPTPETWQSFRDDLSRLIALLVDGRRDAAQEEVIARVSEAARALGDTDARLLPATIELSNDASPDYTRLVISSADTLGFLFAFANALTMLNVNIERAEVRTEGDEVRDTFWLTDSSGHKISEERRLNELRVAAALIKQFTRLLPRSPNPAQALRQFNALTQQILANPGWTDRLRDLESAPVLQTLAEMMGVSQFLWEDFLRMQHENLFPVLLDVPAPTSRGKPKDALYREWRERMRSAASHEGLVQALNSFKDREMFRIDLRHITNRIGFREFAQELSDLSEVVVDEAAKLSHQALASRYGSPLLDGIRACPWAVCALGKFGGRELGFGSDIELLFVYEGEGRTDGAESIQNSLYFGNFARAFLSVLKAKREGIFEIDLRLRPYGDKGAMASALDEFRRYYSPDGFARQFERMALVKLRPVAGDPAFGEKIVQARDAFVYSGAPLDIENILHLRRRQAAELVRQGTVNAKYSPGGLVDLEYYVQARQIATGRRDPDKSGRVTNTLDAIERLAEGGHMSRKLAEMLQKFYAFLRRLIDALRAVRGHAKDLTIPPTDSREFAYLTHRLQFRSPAELQDAIASCMDATSKVWDYGVAGAKSA